MFDSKLKILLALAFTISIHVGFANITFNNLIFVRDTTVGSKIITDEIAGSAFRKSAKGYFVIVDKDTTGFTCVFSESKTSEMVMLEFLGKNDKTSNQERMEYLKIILPYASKDYNISLLKLINFDRLVSNGDLAIDVTKEYKKKFGPSEKIGSYKNISTFLEKSKLCTDINSIFKPYLVSVIKGLTLILWGLTKKLM